MAKDASTEGKPILIGLGEALFDLFPDRESLGGAPLNVAVHAHQLGNEGIVASRIGDDERGRQVIRHLRSRAMRADYLQIDEKRKTGVVHVLLDEGEPTYDIVEGVAWDAIQFDRRFANIAARCDGVCFGTLGQRKSESRRAIQRFVENASMAIRLFDVNLRQEYFCRELIEDSLALATAVKLNAEEITLVNKLLELGAEEPIEVAQILREKFELDFVATTRGADGVIVYVDKGPVECKPVSADVSDGDRVGAGDSASAALLHGRVRGWTWERTIDLANAIGALVASNRGACPPLDESVRQLLD